MSTKTKLFVFLVLIALDFLMLACNSAGDETEVDKRSGPACSSVHPLETLLTDILGKDKSNAMRLLDFGVIKTVPAGTSMLFVEAVREKKVNNIYIFNDYVKVKLNGEVMYMPTWAVAKNR